VFIRSNGELLKDESRCKANRSRLAKSENKVATVVASVYQTIVGKNRATSSVEGEGLAGLRVTVDAGDGVVESWRGVGEAEDQLCSVGRVVLVVVGDAEAVALAADVLLV